MDPAVTNGNATDSVTAPETAAVTAPAAERAVAAAAATASTGTAAAITDTAKSTVMSSVVAGKAVQAINKPASQLKSNKTKTQVSC
jgi:hypothetical protein